MIIWTKKDLEEMCGDDVIDQLAFLAGCFKHKLINDEPDGWIIPDESLRKFAELITKEIVEECAKLCVQHAGLTPRMIAEQVKQHFGIAE